MTSNHTQYRNAQVKLTIEVLIVQGLEGVYVVLPGGYRLAPDEIGLTLDQCYDYLEPKRWYASLDNTGRFSVTRNKVVGARIVASAGSLEELVTKLEGSENLYPFSLASHCAANMVRSMIDNGLIEASWELSHGDDS